MFHGWAKVDASTVGMTQDGLDTRETSRRPFRRATSIPARRVDPGNGMIVRHGQLVHSWGDIDERLEMKSVTKSMGGIVLGLALDENKVALTDKGIDYMPTFGTPPAANAAQAQLITLAQLATHTSGFDEAGRRLHGPHAVRRRVRTGRYSDAGLNWLADVLTTVYQQDLRSTWRNARCGACWA